MARLVDPRFPELFRQLLADRAMSFRVLAMRTFYSHGYLHDLATGRKTPTPEIARRLDEALTARGRLAALVVDDAQEFSPNELALRVAASDLGGDTLTRLEVAVDELAMAYTGTAPDVLLPRVGDHLKYVRQLVDLRMTLAQQRRLTVAGSWLALLAGTMYIDLLERERGLAYVQTARELAEQAEHREIVAWTIETAAWDKVTTGDFMVAARLSREAQQVAPVGSSAMIQATAQEGRAWARLGQRVEVHDALDRTARLVAGLATPDQAEHHYRYDPAKAVAYTATTLAWSGDPAAEDCARVVVADLEASPIARPRRTASARLDLGLALIAAGQPEEAAAVTVAALQSGRIVASNWWRVTEILAKVERLDVRDAIDVREAYETFRPPA